MNKGNYFELDKESISIDNKMVVFNYLRYKNNNTTCSSNERIQPEYPIYVVFTKDGVRFYIHTCEHDDNNERINHYSGCILFLPISLDKDFHNELTTILNTGCNSRIPIKKGKIITNTDIKEYGSDIKLFISDKKDKEANQTDKSISIGQLILDFMFDMEHSTVFKNSVLYNNIYSRLHEHFLYDAINTKAEYNFYKNICGKDNSDLFAQDMFSRIERKWVEIITNPKSEYLFHESLWFKDVIDEMNAIYESDKSCLDLYEQIKNEKDSEKIKNRVMVTSEISRDWYMSKYRLDGVFRIRYGEKHRWTFFGGFYVPMVVLSLFSIIYLLTTSFTSHIFYKILMISIPSICLVFMLLSYFCNERSINRSLFKHKTFQHIIMPRLFAGICAGWMTIGLSSILYYEYTNYVMLTLFCILLITGLFTGYSVRKMMPFERKMSIFKISLLITAVSMFYSIVSGYGLFKIYESGAKETFNPLNCQCDAKTLLLFSSLSMFVGVFINLLFHNKSISSYE